MAGFAELGQRVEIADGQQALMATRSSSGPAGIYFGWYNVGFALLSIMLVVGATSYSFGLFVKPVAADLGLSRASLNIGLSVFYIGSSIFYPVVGALLDRMSIITVYRVSAILFAAGMVGLGIASSPLIMAFFIAGPIAMSIAGCGALFSLVLVAGWFSDQRGRALTITALGTSFGGLVMYPLIGLSINGLGWRSTLICFGLAIGALLVIMSFLIRARPDEETAARLAARVPTAKPGGSLSPARILANRDFWLIAGPVAMLLAVDQTLLTTLTPFLQDRGMSLTAIATVMSATTASAIAGKLLIAWIADRSDLRLLLAVTGAFGLVLCLTLLSNPSYPLVLTVSLFTGLAIGGTLPLSSALIAQRFGAASIGTVTGLMTPIFSITVAGSLYFVGAAHDRTGSYNPAFIAFSVICLIAMCLLSMARRQAVTIL